MESKPKETLKRKKENVSHFAFLYMVVDKNDPKLSHMTLYPDGLDRP